MQALTVNALEPEWEAKFEPRSYGFRPGRGCQDAIAAIFWTLAGPRTKRRWALDADLKAAFDHADHHHILNQIGGFPARDAVAGWLKAGVIGKDGFAPTEEGNSAGRGDQPPDLQRCAARDGGSRRGHLSAGPLPADRGGSLGHAGAGEVRR